MREFEVTVDPEMVRSLNARVGYDGTQHRLIGLEGMRVGGGSGSQIWAVCECGWIAGPIRLATNDETDDHAHLLHDEHVASQPR